MLMLARTGQEWATQVKAATTKDDGTDEAWDIPSLLEGSGYETVDLLKVDIERSELEVFGPTSSQWLHQVRNICIELHGDDCTEVFYNALEGFTYDSEHSGELSICRSLKRRSAVEIPII